MNRFILLSIAVFICGCASVEPPINNNGKSDGFLSVQMVNKGMSVKDMLSRLVPVAETSPCFKSLDNGLIKYYFGFPDGTQVWIEVENPNDLLSLGPSTPNGIVSDIGNIEPRQVWEYKWEDSNQLK